jgi:hypothetical protein
MFFSGTARFRRNQCPKTWNGSHLFISSARIDGTLFQLPGSDELKNAVVFMAIWKSRLLLLEAAATRRTSFAKYSYVLDDIFIRIFIGWVILCQPWEGGISRLSR